MAKYMLLFQEAGNFFPNKKILLLRHSVLTRHVWSDRHEQQPVTYFFLLDVIKYIKIVKHRKYFLIKGDYSQITVMPDKISLEKSHLNQWNGKTVAKTCNTIWQNVSNTF